jgi:hypothetical protein
MRVMLQVCIATNGELMLETFREAAALLPE